MMQVSEFLAKIEAQGNSPLLFELSDGQVVRGGYHVTEIKNATYDTIDCGNSLHTWNEVIVQVWVPEDVDSGEDWMGTDKFLKIWNVVDSRLQLYRDAEIRIEYGDESHLTSNYDVQDLVATEDGLVVQMRPPRTMCKPREILVPLNNVGKAVSAVVQRAMSQAPARLEKVIPLNLADVGTKGSSCCAPTTSTNSSSCCG